MAIVINNNILQYRKKIKCKNCIHYNNKNNNNVCTLFLKNPYFEFENNEQLDLLYLQADFCRKYNIFCGPYATYFKAK